MHNALQHKQSLWRTSHLSIAAKILTLSFHSSCLQLHSWECENYQKRFLPVHCVYHGSFGGKGKQFTLVGSAKKKKKPALFTQKQEEPLQSMTEIKKIFVESLGTGGSWRLSQRDRRIRKEDTNCENESDGTAKSFQQ